METEKEDQILMTIAQIMGKEKEQFLIIVILR